MLSLTADLMLQFFQRLSGLLTARFILHLRRYSNIGAINLGVRNTSHSSNSSGIGGNISTFRAVGNTVASSLDDFGDDPVARARRVNTSLGE